MTTVIGKMASKTALNYISDLTSEPIPLVEDSPISDFYREKTVLLTGATGNIGQLILEKLLRIGTKSVYILLRGKKDLTAEQRFQKTMDGVIFKKLHKANPDSIKSVKVINGDLYLPGLGISENDIKAIKENVQIIIHSAADIRFDVSLLEIIRSNLKGTKEILDLAKASKDFELFTYVSTAFSHSYRTAIQEQFYQPAMNPNALIRFADMLEAKSEAEGNFLSVTDKLIAPWPNTYTFTKAMSEDMVKQFRAYFPVAIVRPSIVIGTHTDPIIGWVNKFSGLNGAFLAVGLGIFRTFLASEKVVIDVVCGDHVSNSTIVATAYTAKKMKQQKNVQINDENIFHIVSGSTNPFTLEFVSKNCAAIRNRVPFSQAVWYLAPTLTTCKQHFHFMMVWHYLTNGIFADLIMKYKTGKSPLLPIFRKSLYLTQLITYFLTFPIVFEMKKTRGLLDWMTDYDKELFPMDVNAVEWNDYIFEYILGLRAYLIKDTEPREVGLRKNRNLKIIYFIWLICNYLLIAWLLSIVYRKYFS